MNLPIELSENLAKNRVIIVEDFSSAPGRAFLIAKAISNLVSDKKTSVFANEIPSSCDFKEAHHSENNIDTVKQTIKMHSQDLILLHSMTQVLLENSVQTVIKLLSMPGYFL